jgi:beta-lactamase class A
MIDHSRWTELEKSLGPHGRLGIAAQFFNADQSLEEEIAFNADVPLPMASTAKIAIAMLASSEAVAGRLALDEQIEIHRPVSPGLVRSPLDHLFYLPFEIHRRQSVDRLLGFMIHRSDNTASDVLTRKLGGVPSVMKLIRDLGIRNFHLQRTFVELINFYFGLRLPLGSPPEISEILRAVRRLHRPYVCRETTEQALMDSGEDCCTPRAMMELLAIIATQSRFAMARSHMERCAGGLNRIRAGLGEHTTFVKTFAHKTGSLGGIANDAGIVELVDGSQVIICVMTCRATAPMQIRDQQIAEAARLIIGEAVRRGARRLAEARSK